MLTFIEKAIEFLIRCLVREQELSEKKCELIEKTIEELNEKHADINKRGQKAINLRKKLESIVE